MAAATLSDMVPAGKGKTEPKLASVAQTSIWMNHEGFNNVDRHAIALGMIWHP